jgi:DNA polymerase-3 subunit delta'
MARASRSDASGETELLVYDRVAGWPLPQERGDWLGEAAAERTLLDAYRSGRIHHAWLIGGSRGIGKATLAYRFARFVLANPDPRAPRTMAASDLSVGPDNPAFRLVANRAHPNLLILERPWDFETRRFRTQLLVDEVRRTVSFFGTTGGEQGWRIAIIDPADDMNPSAANALLKVLEEPPARALFLIVSHAPGRLLPTIRSRTRRLDLGPLSRDVVLSAITASPTAAGIDVSDLNLAAALAEGSLRRAIVLLEGEGIALYRALTGLLRRLPEIDMAATHALADLVSGYRNDQAWTVFRDLVSGWLSRRVRGDSEPDGAVLPTAVAAAPLERWAEVWDTLHALSERTDEYNLDRKQTVLTILMSLARATRM